MKAGSSPDPRCARAIAVVSAIAVLTVLGLSPVLERTSAEATPLVIVQISVWTPAVLLAVGWLGSMAVHIGPLSGIAVGASLLFGVTSALAGDSQTSLRILACDLGVIASVFCVDQLRGARRAFEPKPERPAQG